MFYVVEDFSASLSPISLVPHFTLDAVVRLPSPDVLVVIEEDDAAREQVQYLWQNIRGDFLTFLAAPEANGDAEKISALKRALGAFQLVLQP